MNELQQTKYENLIIDIITQNDRYRGNEDLLKYIYDDVLTRLGGILETINDETVVRSYIERVAKLSVITTIKKRNLLLANSSNNEAATPLTRKYSGYYDALAYTPSGVSLEKNVKKQQVLKLKSEIIELAKQYPQKEFVKLYNLRYIENRSLEAISDELNVSQAQAAERLFDLAAPVKRIFGNEVS